MDVFPSLCAGEKAGEEGEGKKTPGAGAVKEFKKLRISGPVALENWPQILQSFILPLKDNRVTVNIDISATATSAVPITENSMNYKITKESASQLGLDFKVEE